jgi:lysozyme|tara:strand:+ start:41 stop:541 length:501 start_codon:yes stop_codon:yes gene_type:complete
MKTLIRWFFVLVVIVLGLWWFQMRTSEAGILLIKSFEGCRTVAYQDAVGVWTIGYGHTIDVKEGMTITQHQCDVMLEVDIETYENYVNKYVVVFLTQNQFDALVSWVYNLGPTNFRKSTMLKVLNAGKYDEVPYQMKRWNRAGGQVLKGLVIRREAEAELFNNESN